MFCQNCGTQNNDASVFCENCGAKLEKPVQQAVQWEQPNVGAEQVQPNMASQPMQPKKQKQPKQPISKAWIVVAVEALVLVAAIAVFFNFGQKMNSAEKVAEKFFVEVANHNFKEAYKTLDIEESDFINEKNFESASCNTQLSKVNTYEVKEHFGTEKLGKEIEIEYRTKGSSSNRSYYVSVNKKSGKNFLFFDKWEVSPEALIVDDYYIFVPKGAEVTVDDVKLGKDYYSKKESSDYNDCYIIPEMFAGEHQIVVTKEGMQEVRKIVDTDDDYSFYVDNMSIDEKLLEEAFDTAIVDLQKLYEAAAAGKDIKELSNIIDKDAMDDVEYSYENMVSCLEDSSYEVVNKVSISNVEGTAYQDSWSSEENLVVEVELEYDYVVDYTRSWFDEVTNKSYDDSNNSYISLVYKDGKWAIVGLSGMYLYY